MAFNVRPVLTVDIVGFSTRPSTEQMLAIQALIQLLRVSIPEDDNHLHKRIWSPAGDGGSITFLENIHAAIDTAIALGDCINKYNQYCQGVLKKPEAIDPRLGDVELPRMHEAVKLTRTSLENLQREGLPKILLDDLSSLEDKEFATPEELWDAVEKQITQKLSAGYKDKILKSISHQKEPLQVRIGIHAGPVSKEVDFDDRENIWGAGINISARITSLVKPGQIGVSRQYYDQAELKTYNQKLAIHPIGKWWAKHHVAIELFNVYHKEKKVGIPITEVGEWYTPFHHPLQQAISVYTAMLKEEKIGFRTLGDLRNR